MNRNASHRILLVTLNARYSHASLALRYLHANMGELTDDTAICEFTINGKLDDIAQSIAAKAPAIVGLGVYIWNRSQTEALMRLLKAQLPELILITGGPEVTHDSLQSTLTELADYRITGMADLAFARLCKELLTTPVTEASICQPGKTINALPFDLNELSLPYSLYDDHDLAHRNLYVEASRGCPFKCEFCLSSLDKTAVAFPIDRFMEEINALYERGARQFRFVDRTFNLKASTCERILSEFLSKDDDRLFLHFEMIPDRLPGAVRELLPLFPAGVMQLEIGVQTFNPDVQQRISRKQDNAATKANLRWLIEHTQAHLHVDLIVGLPGETLDSVANGFDALVALNVHEIQVGILKLLPGTPLARHVAPFDMVFNCEPPYDIQSNSTMSATTIQQMKRFARYWDLIGNSGRFSQTLQHLLGNQPFKRFLSFSNWLWDKEQRTSGFNPEQLFTRATEWLDENHSLTQTVQQALAADSHVFKHHEAAYRHIDNDGGQSTPARQRRHLQ